FGTATLILVEKPGLCRFFQELVPKPCAFSAQSISFGTSSILQKNEKFPYEKPVFVLFVESPVPGGSGDVP
ncbi:MAG: hypothetical protein LBD96_08650, partial [Treponema sp.]|nr:hypothetical protein [Treponema sp.]